jgi:hypothetical protein
VPAGTNLTFTVFATGTQPLNYQWFFNDLPITGVTGTNLFLTLAQPTNSGRYSTLATNLVGTNYADIVNLSVIAPPTVLSALFNSANQIQISWPTGAVAYALYSSSNLSPAIWIPVIPAPIISNGQFQVIIPPTNSQQFFRLSQP